MLIEFDEFGEEVSDEEVSSLHIAFSSLSLRFHFVRTTPKCGTPCAERTLSLRFHFAFTSTRAERRYDSARCERPDDEAVRARNAGFLER